ncbi:MAG: ABC transporter substrate-binding protein [Bacteroidetes bacterium HGW-Bacteroidetes-12]|nr:MAG: ABC transporter substrate-binding protein [Bacteroidetes bacterium HGW-Bacteroidetes-12]
MKNLLLLIVLTLLFSCKTEKKEQLNEHKSWEEIEIATNGKTVTWVMWQGDLLINKYVNEYVVPSIKQKFNINLKVINGQGNELISALMTEMEAKKTESAFDMLWINGETFFQLRQINGLFGPFTEKLPNNQYINWENPFINTDFQQPVDGMECPWGNVQLAIIYNAEKIPTPPTNLENLAAWVKENPSKFTFPNDFTGMTLLKSWLIHFAGGKDALAGKFEEEKYQKASKKLWDYIKILQPYLWKNGKTFPNSTPQQHQLFANGEIWFTMSNNDSEVDNKIAEGLFPPTSKAFVFESGTIQNSHYLGIVNHSNNKEAAMVVINFLASPEAQYEKMKPSVWGDATILDVKKLTAAWQEKFAAIPGRKNAPNRTEIQEKALQEPAPEYMIRLFEDFRKEILEK